MSSEEADSPASPEAILAYQKFATGTLEPAWRTLERDRLALEATAASCNELVKLIDSHNEKAGSSAAVQPMEALVDCGERCIVQASIPDPSRLVVDMGVLGILVEMDLADAREFASKRADALGGRIRSLAGRQAVVAEDLAEAHALLAQLQGIALGPSDVGGANGV